MRRRRKKFDIFLVIFLAIILVGYFVYNNTSSESRGITAYQKALESYKKADYETAYQVFAKVPSGSTLKESALFRQARCATNMDKKELQMFFIRLLFPVPGPPFNTYTASNLDDKKILSK